MRFSQYTLDTTILKAVYEGLSKDPKSLPSWMFYDETGNKLFQAIMQMPEYYPTKCEYEILQNYKSSILDYFHYDEDIFQLIELGAGDGIKTQILLEHFVEENVSFRYVPVDVSETVLQQLRTRIKRKLPALEISPRALKYEDAFPVHGNGKMRNVILFLGANIGNYTLDEAHKFLMHLNQHMQNTDLLFIGFDLKKDPRVIQLAYDDPNGITKSFNLNLLRRINHELGADFHLADFSHCPLYDPLTGEAKSYLVSLKKQQVYIDALHRFFSFDAWETIHTEVSQKYSLKMIEALASKSGFEIVQIFSDRRKYFADVLLRKK
jgi:L-histidine Nalpha-methyltransferase